MDSSSTTRQRLVDATRRFCDDFSRHASIDVLLTHFSRTQCEVLEHGLKFGGAPFLGHSFRGHDGVRYYLSTLAALVTYENMRFSEFVVDTDVRKVSVKGNATFSWIATRQSWDETFAYVIDFDEQYEITRYQIWGDTGALYLARQGSLSEGSPK